jgi:hypothetical protein
MKWRVMVELIGSDGTVHAHEVNAGGSNTAECSAETVGLTLADGKRTLAGLQDHLVQAQTLEYCRQRRLCAHCGSQRPLKDVRARRLLSVWNCGGAGTALFALPGRGDPASYGQSGRGDHSRSMHARIRAHHREGRPCFRMPPARILMAEFLPLGDVPAVETTRRRTMRVGARLEQQAVASHPLAPAGEAQAIALSIDGGHVRSVRSYQVRSFEVMLAQVSNDDGKQRVFSSMPAEADRRQEQLRGVLRGLGATPVTPVTILSDGADGPRSLGEAASVGPTRHVLDWFHLSMRIQHVAQAAEGWSDASAEDRRAGTRLSETIARIRWRLWHGRVGRRLDLIGETMVTLEATTVLAGNLSRAESGAPSQ